MGISIYINTHCISLWWKMASTFTPRTGFRLTLDWFWMSEEAVLPHWGRDIGKDNGKDILMITKWWGEKKIKKCWKLKWHLLLLLVTNVSFKFRLDVELGNSFNVGSNAIVYPIAFHHCVCLFVSFPNVFANTKDIYNYVSPRLCC